ncbi:amino acid adenylation domain-containing protein [Streptomyces sp. NPDC006602]|uniref:non-ribosomal peptide synthetase n=1 Tax=Streptomyces sp. NPDC006602 TaxID=3364751 RepID=UPI00368DC9BC
MSDQLALHPGPFQVHQGGPSPASFSQARLWFADQMGQRGLEFVYPYAMRLRGALDVAALSQALDGLVARHETLRTTFTAPDGEPLQTVNEPYSLALTAVELGAEDDAVLHGELRAAIEIPFDISRGPVLRTRLWRTGPDEHVFLLVIHHIATDGWSMEILFRELGEAYDALTAGRVADFAPLTTRFSDVARRERERFAAGKPAGDQAEDLAFWRKHLDGCPHVIDLPLDHPRPAAQTFKGRHLSFDVPASVAVGVDGLGKKCGASTYMVLLAAFEVLLTHWSGRRDFIVGMPVANREASDTEDLVGFFMNILPVRARLDMSGSFRDLVASVRETTLDAYDYQELSFDRLVEEISPERSLAHNALVQVTFNMEREPRLAFDGIRIDTLDVRPDIARYDLAVDYVLTDEGHLRFGVSYASDLFERETIEALAQRYALLLDSVLRQPDAPLSALPVQDPAEESRLLALGSGPEPAATASGVLERFRAAVAATPDGTAVVDGDLSLSFREVDLRARSIARLVSSMGAGPGSVVGVCMARSADLLATMLGVLRAGAAYLPLDPHYPAERLAYLVGDSGAQLVLTRAQDPLPEEVQGLVTTVRIEPQLLPEPEAGPGALSGSDIHPDQCAYVIYTSGSTGLPKGVQVSHGSLSQLVAGLEESGAVRPQPGRVGWNASPSFDASVAQWTRVCRGDTVVVVPEELRRVPDQLSAFVVREQLTDLHVTPSYAEHLLEQLASALPSDSGLRSGPHLRLWIGGEVITPPLWQAVAAVGARTGMQAINVYGTSETTVDNIWALVTAGQGPRLATVLPGQSVRVLDDALRPVPRGVRGELYVGGPAVARGYLGRPGQTASRFLPDPWGPAGSRMYRTGDLARWTFDGRLEITGRTDHQVKVRGYRIEPGEIEVVLTELSDVLECAVVRTEQDGTAAVAAFVRMTPAGTVGRVREHAERYLPEWMRPSTFTPVDEMPLTPAGKLDRSALMERGTVVAGRPEHAGGEPGEAAPLTATEALLIGVCQEVLGVEGLRPGDHFFEAGGHSLLAIRVVARIKRRTKLSIPMTAVFEHPVISDLASHVEQVIRERMASS